MRALVIRAAVALGTTGAAQAQQIIHWPVAETAPQAAQTTYFPIGTPLTLVTRTPVSTKTSRPGERIFLYVAEPLAYREQVVIPTGAIAVGEVAQSERNGHLGKQGRIVIRLVSIETSSGPVRLTGTAQHEGKSGVAASVATIAFVSPLGALIHGTSAHLPAGSFVQGYLAEPLRFLELPQASLGREARPDVALPARFDPSAFTGATVTAVR